MSDFDDLDLNIANYDLDDLLKLFQLSIHFNEEDLHNVKKYVLLTHPDKSKLPDKYFLFFKQAYNHLLEVHNFRNKKTTKREKAKDLIEHTENIIINTQKSKQDIHKFNKKFNALFEKHVPSTHTQNGYGEWLQEHNDTKYSCNNRREMNDIIDNKKRELRSIVKHNDIQEMCSENLNNIDDLDGTTPGGYQSAMFSKLTYDDIKHAHEESVIPVTLDDMQQKPSSVENMKIERSMFINPKKNSHEILLNKQNNEDKLASYRAHRLVQQDEIARKATENWLGGFKHLTNS